MQSAPAMIHLFGRPRRGQVEKLRAQQEAYEMAEFMRAEEVKHTMREKLDQMLENMKRKGAGIPEELTQFLEMALSLSTQSFNPPRLAAVPNLNDQLREFVYNRAYNMPGLFVDRSKDGAEWIVYDFSALLEKAERIVYSRTAEGEPMVEIRRDCQTAEILSGPAVQAFLGLLHYLGVFLVEAARSPCPDCTPGPVRDCDTCGGLQWVIQEPAAAATAPDGLQVPLEVDAEFLGDFPKASVPLEEALKSLDSLQRIREACRKAGPGSSEEALCEIEEILAQVLGPVQP